jgi:hypothetical protein
MLEAPNNLRFTIFALALESGINSKSSLNRIFYTIMGLTPRYKDSICRIAQQISLIR